MAPWYMGPFVRVADLPGRRALRSADTNRLTVPAVKLSTIVAERFPFPVLKRGTNYRKKSPLRHLCLPSNVASRHSYSENHSRTLLLIDTLVDLVVILYYLSHSKNSACLFHAERRWVTSVPWWMSRSHCLPCQSIFYWVFTLHCLLVPCTYLWSASFGYLAWSTLCTWPNSPLLYAICYVLE